MLTVTDVHILFITLTVVEINLIGKASASPNFLLGQCFSTSYLLGNTFLINSLDKELLWNCVYCAQGCRAHALYVGGPLDLTLALPWIDSCDGAQRKLEATAPNKHSSALANDVIHADSREPSCKNHKLSL